MTNIEVKKQVYRQVSKFMSLNLLTAELVNNRSSDCLIPVMHMTDKIAEQLAEIKERSKWDIIWLEVMHE